MRLPRGGQSLHWSCETHITLTNVECLKLEQALNTARALATAPGSAPQPQSHGPTQGTSAASDNNIFSHCSIAEDNNFFTIGMRVCNFLVTRIFQGSSFNFPVSLLLPRCLRERIVQNSWVAWKRSWSLLIFFRTRFERVTPCGI